MSEQMKPSGIDWIGDVPQSWNLLKLKYFSYLKGRIGWQGLTADEFTEEGPYLITGTDFENGRIQFDRSYHISEERYSQSPEIQLKKRRLISNERWYSWQNSICGFLARQSVAK